VSLPRWLAGANPRRTAVRAAAIVAAYIVFGYMLLPVRGVGISMQPTIESGELIFVNLLSYRFREPQRGDIVAIRLAGRSVVYVKRLVALPGDRVAFAGGVLSINDEVVEEPSCIDRPGSSIPSRWGRTTFSWSATIAGCRWPSTRWARRRGRA
jgi:signal peptidase I